MLSFKLCRGYNIPCCDTCRRFFGTVTAKDEAQAEGKPMLVPSIHDRRCGDWLPETPAT